MAVDSRQPDATKPGKGKTKRGKDDKAPESDDNSSEDDVVPLKKPSRRKILKVYSTAWAAMSDTARNETIGMCSCTPTL